MKRPDSAGSFANTAFEMNSTSGAKHTRPTSCARSSGRREKGISLIGMLDPRQVQARTLRQQRFKQLRATNEKHFLVADQIANVVDHLDAFTRLHRAAQHNVAAAWKRFAYRIKGLAPHQDGMTQRGLLEELQVLRQPPGQRAVLANHTVAGHAHDSDEAGQGHEP